jgi:transcription initiation factor TFIIF subunit beta
MPITFYLYRYAGKKAEASLMLSEAVLALKETDEKEIPKEYKLDVSPVTSQTLGVFSHIVRKYDIISN